MGVSVSASFALIFVSVFFAVGTAAVTAGNVTERVHDARVDHDERMDRVAGTAVDVRSVTVVDATTCDVNVSVNNTGDTTLAVSDTDLLLDGEYVTDWASDSSVDDDGTTDLWLPGERLEIDVGELLAAPDRVKVVTGPGVADVREVSSLTC